ncbi:MAG: VTT domain-containing protein [Bacteroidales bacterium]|jgi:membrane protein YqaA with SNARE-associated domain|nr:VTT domain-containing protein [Bacteroidales bacterium]
MRNNFAVSNLNTRIKVIHKYNKYTGFYTFIWGSLKKSFLPIVGFVLAVVLFDIFVLDISDLFVRMTETYPTVGVLGVFFASESLLGLIPPEIFIGWSEKTESPIIMLSILATLSYLGGVISYGIGKLISRTPALKRSIETKMHKHIVNVRKWGGLLIIVGALLPIPFSMVSIASGIIDYKFKTYLMFGSLRFVRFYLYAIAIFSMV